MRKIILNMAMSLDGYISDIEGGYDWIKGDGDSGCNTDKMFDFKAFMDSIDIIVMGRKSYEDIGVDQYSSKKVVVATSRRMENHDNIEFVNEDIVGYIRKLQKEEGKNIWLFGGSGLTDHFIKADVVDEFIIGIIPIILGEGRPMFFNDNPSVKLHLDSYTVQEGLPVLVYSRREQE